MAKNSRLPLPKLLPTEVLWVAECSKCCKIGLSQQQQQHKFERFGIGSRVPPPPQNAVLNLQNLLNSANHSPQDGLYVSLTTVTTFPTNEVVIPKDEMMITQQIVSEKLLAYLDNQLSFNQIVAWAENVIHDGNFTPDSNIHLLVGIVRRLDEQPLPAQAGQRELMKRPEMAVMLVPRDAA